MNKDTEEKKMFLELLEEISKVESAKEITRRLGLRLVEKEIKVKASDWNWLIYACSQFAKVIGWMYELLADEEVKEIENSFETEIKEKRMRAFLKYLFEEFKKG
jgi:hypothetical protein